MRSKTRIMTISCTDFGFPFTAGWTGEVLTRFEPGNFRTAIEWSHHCATAFPYVSVILGHCSPCSSMIYFINCEGWPHVLAGFRVTQSFQVPVGSWSLVYVSSDGRRSVVDNNIDTFRWQAQFSIATYAQVIWWRVADLQVRHGGGDFYMKFLFFYFSKVKYQQDIKYV